MGHWFDATCLPEHVGEASLLDNLSSWMQLCHDSSRARAFRLASNNGHTMLAFAYSGGKEVIVGLFNKFTNRGYIAAA